ncbi:MAG: DNA damage-inducible protein D [Candidatus Izemoplasmatales bacterium]|nr:DNA damage-inducible protein D [Candidatus Izemoplasmatales bacterium]
MEETIKFDDYKHMDVDGIEFWQARELQPLLDYSKWSNFNKVIKTAMIACKISNHDVDDHFIQTTKQIELAKTAQRKIIDYKLSRYACYLIVMNGDPRKKIIADGQTYFAVKTRQQEFQELYNQLSEDEKRLFIRSDIKQRNMLLAESARNAGVITPLEFAIFQDSGYKGLYNGLTAKDIASLKSIDEKDDILDYMGSEELAANLFRITQTEGKLKKEHITSKSEANKVHYEVGQTIRKAITEIGGTMPEELPPAEKSIKELEQEKRKLLKDKK